MYGSILVVLSTLELFGNSASPQVSKGPANNARPVEPEMSDLSGYYTCKGQEAAGKSYSGIVVLTRKNDVYVIQWVVGAGSTFSGIAIRQGPNLAASWTMPGERGIVRGVNLYRVETVGGSPRLVGRWASIPGTGVQQPEELRFLKKLDQTEEEEE